jgi:hypothetical protein
MDLAPTCQQLVMTMAHQSPARPSFSLRGSMIARGWVRQEASRSPACCMQPRGVGRWRTHLKASKAASGTPRHQ